MTHVHLCQCLVSCRNSLQSESGQISSKTRALPGSQTAWEAVMLDFIENKYKIIAKDYELHGRCDFLYYPIFQKSGDKETQRYGRRENGVREAGV